jgi:hypothetical protein
MKQFVAFALLPLLAFNMIPQLKLDEPRISTFDSSDSLMPVAHFLISKVLKMAQPFFFNNMPTGQFSNVMRTILTFWHLSMKQPNWAELCTRVSPMVPRHPSSKLIPATALLEMQHVDMLNVQFEVKFKPVPQLVTWVRSAYTHAPSPTNIPIKHFSKLQPMNESGIDTDWPLRKALAPYRLLPEKRQLLKRARVQPVT